MNLSQLFEYWKITENPFRGEEARHDAVFTRMAMHEPASDPAEESDNPSRLPTSVHSDFEKILGELDRPSSAVVFGEKGSGKTAIRLQITDIIRTHNAGTKTGRVFLVPYDDMNAFLDSLHRAIGKKDPFDSFKKIRLVDHMDAIISVAVTRMVDVLLGAADADTKRSLGPDFAKRLRSAPKSAKRDLLLLQSIYDGKSDADTRTRRLKRKLRIPTPRWLVMSRAAAALGWLAPVAVVGLSYYYDRMDPSKAWQYGFIAAASAYLFVLFKRLVWDRLVRRSIGLRISREIRVLGRGGVSWAKSLEQIDPAIRRTAGLHNSSAPEHRYAMFARLRKVLNALGYSSLLVVIDRVDEPTLVSGDPDRMRAIIWPMFDNKFLQLEGVSIKMLLPIELRFALFREPQSFFQKARLDKQNLVERLTWSGAMLYDLCDARLQACLAPDAQPTGLLDLFAEDVTRQDLVDALNEMHQPRDAFKFIYHCLTEHCSNVTKDQNEMRIPRLVVEHIRKFESDRVQQLYRGIRPA